MAQAWGNMQANNGSDCENCHATGGQGMIATRATTSTARCSRPSATNKYYMLQYFTVDLTGGAAAAKVIINTTSFDGVVERPGRRTSSTRGSTRRTTRA